MRTSLSPGNFVASYVSVDKERERMSIEWKICIVSADDPLNVCLSPGLAIDRVGVPPMGSLELLFLGKCSTQLAVSKDGPN